MTTKAKFIDTLEWLEEIHNELFQKISPPQRVRIGQQVAYRFMEKTLEQAIILKLARIVSGLQASQLLLKNGMLQEQASLCRMVDEYCEDVSFLSLAVISNEKSALHVQYLDALFKEEVRSDSPKEDWHKGRHLVSRKKIRSYMANHDLSAASPSDAIAVHSLIGNVYSGYVHAAACQVLEMYDPATRSFRLGSMRRSEFFGDHTLDLNNYFARGCYSFAFAAFALTEAKLSQMAHAIGDQFAGLQ